MTDKDELSILDQIEYPATITFTVKSRSQGETAAIVREELTRLMAGGLRFDDAGKKAFSAALVARLGDMAPKITDISWEPLKESGSE